MEVGVLTPDFLWSLGEGPRPPVLMGVLVRLLGPVPHSP